MQVELKKGETIMTDAYLHLPASFLHEAFSDRSGVPSDHYELYYRGKRLEGEAALSSWGVGKDSTIEVKLRGRGGVSTPGGSSGGDGAGGSDGGGGGGGGDDAEGATAGAEIKSKIKAETKSSLKGESRSESGASMAEAEAKGVKVNVSEAKSSACSTEGGNSGLGRIAYVASSLMAGASNASSLMAGSSSFQVLDP